MSFFRYPGGKSKLSSPIILKMKELSSCYTKLTEYREPFFGGGSLGLKFIQTKPKLNTLWLNDKDINVSCLWTSVLCYPTLLERYIKEYTPSIEDFYKFKVLLQKDTLIDFSNKEEVVLRGFQKLVIHQISYSGLGTKSGGPLGGKGQNSKYKVNCRWSPDFILKKINSLNKELSSYTLKNGICSNLDFSTIILNDDEPALIYLDPPYYIKGNDLYQFGFTIEDHERLASSLRNSSHCWLLSYDDCPEVRKLYSWAAIEELPVTYSITGARKKIELLIYKNS